MHGSSRIALDLELVKRKDMKSDNPVRNLRLALKLNQVEFGRLIGRSHQSVRNYENGIGKIPSSDVIEKMKTLAA